MKPWEDRRTIAKLRRLKGKKVLIGFEMADLGLQLLKARLRQEGFKGKRLNRKLKQIIWPE
jgi:hypothetical protein